jgi:hypothetical protein
MHGAETGGGVWGVQSGSKPKTTRSVRSVRAREVVPESLSSEKPRALGRGIKPQTDIVAISTSERGGAVSLPCASIRKTCPATGVDPSLAGLLKIFFAALILGNSQ